VLSELINLDFEIARNKAELENQLSIAKKNQIWILNKMVLRDD